MNPALKVLTDFAYRHRFQIADGLVLAAFLLKNWNPSSENQIPINPKQPKKLKP